LEFGLVLVLLLLEELFGSVDGELVVEVEDGFVAVLSVGLPVVGELLPLEPVVELVDGEDGLIAVEELPVALSVPREPLLGVVPAVPVEPVVPLEPAEPATPVDPLEPEVPMPLAELPVPAAPPDVPAAPPEPPAAPPPAAPPPDWAKAPAAARETEARIVAATFPILMSSIPP
jgi:hypothetical protein